MSAPPADNGLVHLGMIYDDVDDLVARSLPEIRHVLDGGGDVILTVERSGVRAFREALGPDADRIAFPSPRGSRTQGVEGFLAELRTQISPERRTLILGQYVDTNPPTWDCAYAEDAVNLVLGDLPLTVMCACPRGGDDDHVALAARAHPQLLHASGRTPNPDHRRSLDASPAPMTPWGPPMMATTVRDGDDLPRLRRQVAAAAENAGLVGDAIGAVVLTVHEAVLLAAGAGMTTAPTLPAGGPAVRVHVAGGVIVTEVEAGLVDAPAVEASAVEASAVGSSAVESSAVGSSAVDACAEDDAPEDGDGPRRACLAAFCDRHAVHDGPRGRLVRVLSTVG